jgi:hypothetical protein
MNVLFYLDGPEFSMLKKVPGTFFFTSVKMVPGTFSKDTDENSQNIS